MQENKNVLRILNETLKALEEQNTIKLKQLSDQTIHTASITQDPDNITVAVIVYSLSKIIERQNYKSQKSWDSFYNNLIIKIQYSIDALENNDKEHLTKHLEEIRAKIQGVSRNLKKYVQDVFRKASINKASKIYEHGISMEKTAKLLGISQWELASYTSQKISDQDLGKSISTEQRIKFAMEMFE